MQLCLCTIVFVHVEKLKGPTIYAYLEYGHKLIDASPDMNAYTWCHWILLLNTCTLILAIDKFAEIA